MKKIIKYLSLLVLPIIPLVSCNVEQPVINYGTAWSNDESTHFHLGQGDYSHLKKDITSHTFGEWTISKQPTNTEEGLKERTCSVCGYKETLIISKTTTPTAYKDIYNYDHAYHWHEAVDDSSNVIDKEFHKFTETVVQPTCEADGYTTFVCSSCGYSFRSNYVNALGHNYDSYEIIIEPTESLSGYAILSCSDCLSKELLTLPKLSDSDYDITESTSTCSVNGLKTYTYKSNDLIKVEKTLPKTSHTFGDWVIDTPATDDADGLRHRTCDICGEIEKEAIYALSHTHTFDSAWSYDLDDPDKGHFHHATCEHTEVLGDLEAHNFKVVRVVDATCLERGYTYYECETCGYDYKGDFTDILGHDYHYTVTTEPTITSTGLAKGICSRCSDEVTITLPKLDSTNYIITEKLSTCTTKGYTSYKYKSIPEIEIKVEKGQLGSHDYEIKEVVAPTCKEEGYTVYICKICGDEKHDNVTSKVDHDFAKTSEVVAPTCTTDGYTVYKCNNCDEEKHDDIVSSLGHDYQFDRFELEDNKVYAYYICFRDNTHIDKREVPSTNMSKVNAVPTSDGLYCNITYHVNYDGHETDYELKEDHIYGELVIDTDSTTEAEGTGHKVCSTCGHIKQIIIPIKSNKDDIWTHRIYDGNYYDSITSTILNDATLLKNTLNTIINTGYTTRSYKADQTLLRTVDSYDGYYVECIYSGVRLEKEDAWDREHIWSKSYGFNDESYYAYSDMHHLRVSEHSVNVNKSNKLFAEITSPTGSDEFGNTWTDTYFEPRDDIKGDVARMLLYMTVKYNGQATTGTYSLNLELADSLETLSKCASKYGGSSPSVQDSSKYIDSSLNGITYYGLLSDIIKWHFEDPVDAREVHRNNTLAGSSYHNNRNPFIDHPEYVYYLYKDNLSVKSIIESYVASNEDLEALNAYMNYNETAISNINARISSIGKVTLDIKDTLDSINQEYESLGKVTKSFVTNYHTLKDKNTEYQALYELHNQDKTVATKFEFLDISNKSGSESKNGIDLTYNGASFHTDHGINAQVDKNGNYSDATIKATGIYDTIKYIKISWNNNNLAGKADVTVTDKNGNKVEEKNLTVNKGSTSANNTTSIETLETSKNRNSVYIDISSLDYSGTLTITIRNTSGQSSSVRIAVIGFTITNTQ